MALTARDVVRHQAGLTARVARAVRANAPAVRRAVGAAEAHGRNVLSGATRAAPEGRPTIARVGRHPSYRAGVADLHGLVDILVAAVEAERTAAYRDGYTFWGQLSPGGAAGEPALARVERARTAVVPVHGRTVRQEAGAVLERLVSGYRVALVRAGNKAVPAVEGIDALGAWTAGAQRQAVALLARLVSDAVLLADRMAGRDVFPAEMLLPDPNLPEPV